MITIIDYGMGNLGSIKNMLKKAGHESRVTASVLEIEDASKLILPGVGSFDKAIKNIEALGIKDILNRKVLEDKTPILGICLGMQLLGNKSEEGSLPGFGWIDSEIKRFPKDKKLKVPHMGWNIVKKEREHFLFEDMPHEELRFYFVHTFQMQNTYADDVLSTTEYGLKFTSSTSHENVHGVQFHPEKSHKFGLQLMKNFANA